MTPCITIEMCMINFAELGILFYDVFVSLFICTPNSMLQQMS